ncbi:MAG: O-antigen ligase family protein [Pirellulales bacterium]|nr:O-antigen ligase family protein [Pirellulales bacterium]
MAFGAPSSRKPSSRRGRPAALASDRLAERALAVTDAGLAGVVFVAPLFHGGRHDVGRFVLAACIAVAAMAWGVRQLALKTNSWRRSPANWLFCGGALLLGLQLTPLPAEWIPLLAPLQIELIAPWLDTANSLGVAPRPTASLNPEATRLSLAMWLAYGVLFMTVAQRLQDAADVRRLQRWIGLSAGAMAAIGLLQWALPNGKFLWIYEHPSRIPGAGACGPFANRNHFGHFLVLGAPALAAWAMTSLHAAKGAPKRPGARRTAASSHVSWHERIERGLPATLLAAVIAGALLSASRGAAVALFAAAAAFLPAAIRAERSRTAGFGSAAGLVTAGALAAILLIPDDATMRIATLASGELEEIDQNAGRRSIWQSNWEVIQRNGWLGAGAGAHADVYRTYLPDPPLSEYTHAENGYLQVLTETGRAGGALLVAGVLLVLGWCWRAYRLSPDHPSFLAAAACAACLIASLAHSAVDFVWYIPSCLSITLMHGACLMRLHQLSDEVQKREFRPAEPAVPGFFGGLLTPLTATASAVAVAALLGPARAAPHWDSYLRISRSHRIASSALLVAGVPEEEGKLHAIRLSQQASLVSMLDELSQVVSLRPEFADAHRQLANRSVQLFEHVQQQADNPMPVSEIRAAAIASQFSSSSDLLEWLRAAFGQPIGLLLQADAHARAAASCCPLEGDAIVQVADLAFLHGRGAETVQAAMNQALRVRPYDGDLLLAVGTEAAVRGDSAEAFELWRRSFAIRGSHRLRIARLVAGNMPPEAWLEWLQPEWDSLPVFWSTACDRIDDQQRAAILAYGQARLESDLSASTPPFATRARRTLAEMQLTAGLPEAAAATLELAIAANPNDVPTRRMLGFVLADLQRLPEAEQHLSWCYGRNPNDGGVQRQLTTIRKLRLAETADQRRASLLR